MGYNSDHFIKVFWTTSDPYNGAYDWQEWLNANVGRQSLDWDWHESDVVSGDQDDRTVLTLWFNNPAHLTLFILANKCEYYND